MVARSLAAPKGAGSSNLPPGTLTATNSVAAREKERNTMAAKKPLRAIAMDVNGDYEVIEIDRGAELDTLQERVGGYVECVYSEDDKVTIWANEEGKLIGLPPNKMATITWWKLNPAMQGADILCGPVVITGGADAHGNTKSLTKACLKEESLWVQRLAEAL